jgi:hypothetical protein
MKLKYKAHNVCKWESGMCAYTILDIKRYISALKTFCSYEENKNRLTIVEHQAISQEIEAWDNILGLIGRINVKG